MSEVVYYYDEEAGLNVTSQQGDHFFWYVRNKLHLSIEQYNECSDLEKENIAMDYVAKYIPR